MINAAKNFELEENEEFRDLMSFERTFCSVLADNFEST